MTKHELQEQVDYLGMDVDTLANELYDPRGPDLTTVMAAIAGAQIRLSAIVNHYDPVVEQDEY